jgi:ABC-type transport system involved in cytochrome c biogenesis permease subunit
VTHAHITAWAVAILLFMIAVFQERKQAKTKIIHMILRLFYLLIIGTGAWMLHSIASIPALYVVKTIVGIWVIFAMEMILVRKKKGKSTNVFWLQFTVAFVLVLYLGLKLPLGFYIFS